MSINATLKSEEWDITISTDSAANFLSELAVLNKGLDPASGDIVVNVVGTLDPEAVAKEVARLIKRDGARVF